MNIKREFASFYIAPNCWVKDTINPNNGDIKTQMSGVVFSKTTDDYIIKICRDGQVLISIIRLEEKYKKKVVTCCEDNLNRWNEYLEYLNAFYLLLDSVSFSYGNIALINFQEITFNDAFRTAVCGNEIKDAGTSSHYALDNLVSREIETLQIKYHDSRILPLDVIDNCIKSYDDVIKNNKLLTIFSLLGKSLSEYKSGSNETSLVLSWFVIEKIINKKADKYIKQLKQNIDQNIDIERSNSNLKKLERKKKDGSPFYVSVKTKIKVLSKVDITLQKHNSSLDDLREKRNNIAHSAEGGHGLVSRDAKLSIETAISLISSEYEKFELTPNFNYSIVGL